MLALSFGTNGIRLEGETGRSQDPELQRNWLDAVLTSSGHPEASRVGNPQTQSVTGS